MKSVQVIVALVVVVCGQARQLAAQETQIAEGERIVEIWTCTVNEGYTMDDIGRINERWIELVRSAGATDTRALELRHLVGTVSGHEMTSDISTSFLHVDSFRDVASWAAAKRAEETPEGQDIMSAFKEANTCSGNALYRGRQY